MERIKRIFANTDDSIDTFLISTSEHPNIDPNFFYVSGISSGVFESCSIIAYKNGKGYLLTSQLEEEIARKETKLEVLVFKTKEERESQLKKLLSGIDKLGVNGNNFTYRQHDAVSKLSKAKIVDISKAFARTRSIKDKNEIKLISKACKISSLVANDLENFIKPNMTEQELSRKIVGLQYHHGATSLAFTPSIAAFGRNASEPHHFPGNTRLRRNQFVLTDFGAEFNRYASDISRTFVFGKADKKMKGMYETVLDAQVRSIDMIRDGINGRDADKFARGLIDRRFKGTFIHSLGHEVGLAIHDGNVLSSQTDFVLEDKMVVTVEPGIYIPSVGGVRIEDTVLVTKGKPKILTNAKKNLIEL